MISLTIYILLWILALVFFGVSFVTWGGKRIIFNVIAFLIFLILGMAVAVHSTTALVVNNTVEVVKTHYEGVRYLQYLAWLFMSICIIRGIQHAFLAFTRKEEY